MGIFRGITNYTTSLENMPNSVPHPHRSSKLPSRHSGLSNSNGQTSNVSGIPSSTTSDGSDPYDRPTPSNYTVSSTGIVLQPRRSSITFPYETRSDDSLLGKRTSGGPDDDDDDEDVEIKISPTGSVLAPSPNPYDKTQKIRQANAQLMASRLPPKPPGKVRFNDSVVATEEPGGDHPVRSKKPKTNVTLPPSLKKN